MAAVSVDQQKKKEHLKEMMSNFKHASLYAESKEKACFNFDLQMSTSQESEGRRPGECAVEFKPINRLHSPTPIGSPLDIRPAIQCRPLATKHLKFSPIGS
eukprot:gene1018-4259_t